MKSILATVFFVSTAALFGCGGGGGSGGSVPISQFGSQYSQAMCAQNFKCCSVADIDGRTMQECTETNSTLFSALAGSFSEGQAAGRLTYDAALMGMCIAAIKQLSCDEWKMGLTMSNQPNACKAAVTAKVAAGGACLDDNECMTGNCDGADSAATPPVTGTCTNLIAAGGSCAGVVECADGLTCTSPGNVCAPKKAGGEACTSDSECMNSCNLTTGLCSCYAGCAVGGAMAPRLPLLALALLAAAFLFGKRKRIARH
jgi:MYXO-CTERM domain-containing protein